VWREEFAGLDARAIFSTKPGDAITLGVDDGEPWSEIGRFPVHVHARTEFADDERGLLAAAAAQRAGAMQVIPLHLVFAVAVEHLHAVVLAVGDVDIAVGIGGDVVDDVELAGIGAGFAQVFNSLPSGEYLWTQALP